MKITIIVLNIISLFIIPIPLILLLISPLAINYTFFSISIIFVPIFIFLSQKYQSILLALIGLIPLIICIYYTASIFKSSGVQYKKEFTNSSRDFICGENLFISVEKNDEVGAIDMYEKKGTYSYSRYSIGRIFDKKMIEINVSGLEISREKVLLCKNNNGKSIIEVYEESSQDKISAYLKRIYEEYKSKSN